MPLIFLLRLVFAVLGLAILAGAGYLLWSWYEGETVLLADGTLVLVRENWRLWTGLVALAWSIGGRFALGRLLARRDTDPSRAAYGNGQFITNADGSRLYVETYGNADAPPIILTHGWSMDSTIWFYAKRDLSRSFRVIVWDLPGLGKSEGTIGLEPFANALRSVIAFSGNRPVVLVGHSIGGMTIQTLARDHPEVFGNLVSGVVLVNTTYTNPLKTTILPRLLQTLRFPLLVPLMWLTIWLQPLAWLSAWYSYINGSAHLANRFGFGRYVTRSQLNHTALLSTRNSQAAIAKGNLAMFRWDASGATAMLPVPVLVLAGDRDILTKPQASETIASATPAAELQVIEGVNHCGFLERFDIYNAAIAGFASRVQSTDVATPHPEPLR
jgi:pimeloyl-ACP methyl ester carboxylesterase